jgi:hypothetical protein
MMIGGRYSGSHLSLRFSSLSHDVAHQATAHIAVYPGAVSASPGAGPQQHPAVSKQPITVSRLYLHRTSPLSVCNVTSSLVVAA